VKLVQSVPLGPPPLTPQVQLPVPVTFKALVTEAGPKLQSGLTWRVYASKGSPDSGYKLVSTHREANPTAALLPGEYLVNAAYGLSNLTKKIKVESGHSLEETFVLNTGGLKLSAVLPNGEPLPDGSVRFDILSDEEDQFGNRHTILGNAKPGTLIRLNAGAYHVESLYGDANAKVKCDVTVEPGKLTEATIKQTGAKTTFKLVQSLGGEALADTKWKILTSAGDVVKGECRCAANPYSRRRQLRRGRRACGIELHAKVLDRRGRGEADRGRDRRRTYFAGGPQSAHRSARARANFLRYAGCWRRRALIGEPCSRLRWLLGVATRRSEHASDQSGRAAPPAR
jgi:hypothetical protein